MQEKRERKRRDEGMTEGHWNSFLSSMFGLVGAARHDLHEFVNSVEEPKEDRREKDRE